jgi:hypothetical protein
MVKRSKGGNQLCRGVDAKPASVEVFRVAGDNARRVGACGRHMKHGRLLMLVGVVGILSSAGWAAPLGPESSWAEIRSAPNILIRAPMIWFGTDALSVLDLCRHGDQLRGRTSAGLTVEAPLKAASPSYTIEVDRITGGIRHIREIPLFTKRFTIPPCGEP